MRSLAVRPNLEIEAAGCTERKRPDAYGPPVPDTTQPLQREGSLTTALVTKLITNPLASRGQRRTRVTTRQPQVRTDLTRPAVDGIEEGRFESPEPYCLGGYRIFGRSMH